MALVEIENIRDWRGQSVLDPAGEYLSKVEDFYFDSETDEPLFASMKVGMLGRRLTFVPLEGAVFGRDYIKISHPKEKVKDAPTIEHDGELSAEQEAELHRYYALDYTPPSTQSGRRLARH